MPDASLAIFEEVKQQLVSLKKILESSLVEAQAILNPETGDNGLEQSLFKHIESISKQLDRLQGVKMDLQAKQINVNTVAPKADYKVAAEQVALLTKMLNETDAKIQLFESKTKDMQRLLSKNTDSQIRAKTIEGLQAFHNVLEQFKQIKNQCEHYLSGYQHQHQEMIDNFQRNVEKSKN